MLVPFPLFLHKVPYVMLLCLPFSTNLTISPCDLEALVCLPLIDPRSGDWGPPDDRRGWRKLKTGELPREARQPQDPPVTSPVGGGPHLSQGCKPEHPQPHPGAQPGGGAHPAVGTRPVGNRTCCHCRSEGWRPPWPGGRQLQHREEGQVGLGLPTPTPSQSGPHRDRQAGPWPARSRV